MSSQEAVKELYKELLGQPLSTVAHNLLHTHYYPRPRKAPVLLQSPNRAMPSSLADAGGDDNGVLVVFGTQSGTAAQAAKEIKVELQQFISLSKLDIEPSVGLVAYVEADRVAPVLGIEVENDSVVLLPLEQLLQQIGRMIQELQTETTGQLFSGYHGN